MVLIASAIFVGAGENLKFGFMGVFDWSGASSGERPLYICLLSLVEQICSSSSLQAGVSDILRNGNA